tara:strand:- start:564 stop:1526 length:963 start_codon:yes stop_codon:yes gene_type:complete
LAIDDVPFRLADFERQGTGATQSLFKGGRFYGLAAAQMISLLKRFALLTLIAMSSGCASLVGSVTSGIADRLSSAILNSPDIETVKEAIPAYLVLIDGFLVDGEGDPSLYLAASQLNGAFTALVEEERAQILATKAFDYAQRGACLKRRELCGLGQLPFKSFETRVDGLSAQAIDPAYQLAVAWTGYIQANSGDMRAIGQLGRVKYLLERVLALDPRWAEGSAQLYMGGLETILPASMGGKPEKGRMHFERAIEYSDGRFLMAKVIYAEQYAKLVFDKELHDRLLTEVVNADPVALDLTLINRVAQRRAAVLLAESDEYF